MEDYFIYRGNNSAYTHKVFKDVLFIYKKNHDGYLYSSVDITNQNFEANAQNRYLLEYINTENQREKIPSLALLANMGHERKNYQKNELITKTISPSSIRLTKNKRFFELIKMKISVGGKVNIDEKDIRLSDIFFSPTFDPTEYNIKGGFIFWTVITCIVLLFIIVTWKFCFGG